MAANPFHYDPFPKRAQFIREQKELQDKFSYYRLRGSEGWDAGARAAIIDGLAVPAAAPGQAAVVAPPVNGPVYTYDDDIEPADLEEDAIRSTIDTVNDANMRRQLADMGMRFVKVLGWGSNGLATLWELTVNGARSNVVLKNRFDDQGAINDMRNEKSMLTILARSPHIMQRARLQDIFTWNATGPAANFAAQNLDHSAKLMWTEFIRNGNLDGLMRKVCSQGETFPRSVLWRLFQCLVDGIVALAYPPRDQQTPRAPATAPAGQGDLEENFPPLRLLNTRPHYRNIIHLDLDPQNLFLSHVGTPDHPSIPRVKIGDFGKAVEVPIAFGPTGNYENYEKIWDTRWCGKPGYYLPEQFAAQWDQVDYEPYNEGFHMTRGRSRRNRPNAVAGKYSELSNMFSIALVIRSCMTLQEPDEPPRPRGGRGGRSRFTYGGDLVADGSPYRRRYGDDLCELVARCLQHLPGDRPTLRQLRRRVAAGVAANPVADADRRWMADRLYGAAAPPPPYPVAPTVVISAGNRVPRRLLLRGVPL